MQEKLPTVREIARKLPELLGELLGDPDVAVEPSQQPDSRADLVVTDGHGSRWIAEVKNSSRPGIVANAARQLLAHPVDEDYEDGIPLLVVPFMTSGGAQTAQELGLNWLDLSGNASIKTDVLWISIQGRPNAYPSPGRPSSPFAPRSSRVARTLLLDPARWWRQKDLADESGLDDGGVSRAVRRLAEEKLLETRGRELRPSNPALLLDAWAEDYRFGGHEIVLGHVSGGGMDGTRELARRLEANGAHHAFTGLPAAWALDRFAAFRLITVYVEEDPHEIADDVRLRREARGANVQLVGPNDAGVFAGKRVVDGLTCVAAVQVYLDLLHLPERAAEAADRLRANHLWPRGVS